jgi:hypothetical protein
MTGWVVFGSSQSLNGWLVDPPQAVNALQLISTGKHTAPICWYLLVASTCCYFGYLQVPKLISCFMKTVFSIRKFNAVTRLQMPEVQTLSIPWWHAKLH